MADSATLRRMMVDGQIRTADVTDRSLLDAMLETPREPFAPPAQAGLAYLDFELPAGEAGRRMLKPMVLAKMLQALNLSPQTRVLDVGCATGYAAALLGRLCASVVALEAQSALAAQARANLSGLAGVSVVEGPLPEGCPGQGPYDAILVEGAVALEPERLCGQLADGGQLICILGTGPSAKATLYRCDGGDITQRMVFDAAADTLPGFARPPAFAF